MWVNILVKPFCHCIKLGLTISIAIYNTFTNWNGAVGYFTLKNGGFLASSHLHDMKEHHKQILSLVLSWVKGMHAPLFYVLFLHLSPISPRFCSCIVLILIETTCSHVLPLISLLETRKQIPMTLPTLYAILLFSFHVHWDVYIYSYRPPLGDISLGCRNWILFSFSL